MALYCGIDLGTTNSTVSVIYADKREEFDVIERLRTLPIYQLDENLQLTKDKLTLPSALYFDIENNNVYTGAYAQRIYGDGDRPLQTVKSIKTRIAGEALVEIPGVINKEEKLYVNMVQCSAILLKTIKNSIEKYYEGEVDEAVVTVPAAFNNDERQATQNAMTLAGFKTVHILDEPTAALLYYINKGKTDIDYKEIGETPEYRMIYDMGGGTLDVSIAKMYQNENLDIDLKIIARSPRMDLGGNDFDQYLASYFLAIFENNNKEIDELDIEDQTRIIARLITHAEKEKIEINEKIKSTIDDEKRLARVKQYVNFEVINGINISNIKLTKKAIEELFLDLIEFKKGFILNPIKASLQEAEISKDMIKEIILTGGMANFYAIEATLRDFFGENIDMKYVDTESSVSKGAALYHYHLSGEKEGIRLNLEDRMSDDIFIRVADEFHLLIPRTAQVEEAGIYDYVVQEEGLCEIAIFLYYGIGTSADGYTPISGRYLELERPLHLGESIRLYWYIDENKITHITVDELGEQLEIKNLMDYTEETIRNDLVNTIKINGEEV